MSINVRTKGQTGEREVCKLLNDIYKEVYAFLQMPFPEKDIAQRNQNQSAVGGCDISNTCNFAFEVKRQEQLAINTWWKQTLVSAKELGKIPVLIYRQNGKKWRVITQCSPPRTYAEEPVMWLRCEMELQDFLDFYKQHAIQYIKTFGSAT